MSPLCIPSRVYVPPCVCPSVCADEVTDLDGYVFIVCDRLVRAFWITSRKTVMESSRRFFLWLFQLVYRQLTYISDRVSLALAHDSKEDVIN